LGENNSIKLKRLSIEITSLYYSRFLFYVNSPENPLQSILDLHPSYARALRTSFAIASVHSVGLLCTHIVYFWVVSVS